MPLLLACAFPASALAADPSPREWIDADTGHRVIRLSREPGSSSLYFHQNPFTAAGDKMVITTPDGIATVDLKSRTVEKIVPAAAGSSSRLVGIVVGRTTRQVFYARRADRKLVAFQTDLDSGRTREIGPLPQGGSLMAVNADETLLAGSMREGDPGNASFLDLSSEPQPEQAGDENEISHRPDERKGDWMLSRQQEHRAMRLFTMDIQSGKVTTFLRSTNWLNHVQMSPTDPTLLLFCHEGPWHLVDRIWTARTDGTGLRLMHKRSMEMEIAGHEFFSADGKWIWYDLQTPRGEDFWLAGCEIATGARTWYHLQRDEWSVHYNISPDGSLFAGDGGSAGMVAHSRNGKWLYLFRPQLVSAPRGPPPAGAGQLIRPGVLHAERLVNMSRHDYHLEPNVQFTPDGKWIVFRSNMDGATHVYAVEVARTKP